MISSPRALFRTVGVRRKDINGKCGWRQQTFRFATVLLSVALLVLLMRRSGISRVLEQVGAVGWGLVLVVALGGIAYLGKTLAWRLTFLSDLRDISFARTFGLRLASEAIGSLGLPGQALGETARVYFLGDALPVANRISSVTLDRVLYIMTSGLVCVSGSFTAISLLSISGTWRLCGLVFTGLLLTLLVLSARSATTTFPSCRCYTWAGYWSLTKREILGRECIGWSTKKVCHCRIFTSTLGGLPVNPLRMVVAALPFGWDGCC
jgi:hypothetical protein